MSGLFKTWHRKRTLRRYVLDEALWQHVTRSLPFLHGLTHADTRRLKDYAVLFLDEKEMHGARGFIPTDAVRLSIAVQACLPILKLGLDSYDGWAEVVGTVTVTVVDALPADHPVAGRLVRGDLHHGHNR